jgi:excinuclease ABC subunit C
VPTLPDDAAELEQWLQERRGKRVSLQVAQRGRKADLLRTATINAQQALILHKTRRTSDYTARTKALTDLQLALGMDEAPLRIECYDVSHLSGPTSWHPWWSSKTACRARISTAPSAFRRRPTTPTRCIRC